jgi:hypothetical protein
MGPKRGEPFRRLIPQPLRACSKEDPAGSSRRTKAAGGMGDICLDSVWTALGEAFDRQAATQASIEAVVVKAAEEREAAAAAKAAASEGGGEGGCSGGESKEDGCSGGESEEEGGSNGDEGEALSGVHGREVQAQWDALRPRARAPPLQGVRRQPHLRARAAAHQVHGLPLREGRCGCAGEGSGCARGSGCGRTGERDGSGVQARCIEPM